ncbi:hypothetical protein PTKIN_Ptkin18bG0034600 [Pterospermum kingtungense]
MLTHRPYSLKAMRTTLVKAWQLLERLDIREVGDRLFLFRFDSCRDKNKVLVKKPWSFNKSLIVMKDMKEKVGIVLAKKIGEVEAVETHQNKMAWGKWMRAKVEINVTRSSKKDCRMSFSDGRRRDQQVINLGLNESLDAKIQALKKEGISSRVSAKRLFLSTEKNRKQVGEKSAIQNQNHRINVGPRQIGNKVNANIVVNMIILLILWEKAPIVEDVGKNDAIGELGKNLMPASTEELDPSVIGYKSNGPNESGLIDIPIGCEGSCKRNSGDETDLGLSKRLKDVIDNASNKTNLSTVEFGGRLTGFYGNLCTVRRNISWDLLPLLATRSNLPWLCAGDFNELLSSQEKFDGAIHPARQMEEFGKAIMDCHLLEMPFDGPLFSWHRGNGPDMVLERLDRGIASEDWFLPFPKAKEKHLITDVFDHLPLLFQTEE